MTSQFPGGEMPGMAAMNDTLAFVKKLWGGMQVPGMVTPTISIDDLDKRIKDLKTVESWLNVNMNMLRGTIQALEVQRATIATLNSLGASFSNAMAQPEAPSPFSSAGYGQTKASNPEWPMPPADPASRAAAPDAAAEADEEPDDEAEEDEAEPAHAKTEAAAEDAAAKDAAAAASSQFVNPAAWWTLLQDQFKQAVNNAMAGELTPKEEKAAPAAGKAKSTAGAPAKASSKATAKSGGAGTAKSGGKSDGKTAVKNATAKNTGTKGAGSKSALPATARRVIPKV
ncbi:MAG: PhaM family polyhydroxyalkanoate granule multifunctional regulatory protein [Pseudomonadota bacterium]